MELIVFDLDGTLLNRDSAISEYTRETLRLLAHREVAYTVATGRTLHASRAVLSGLNFDRPHVYKNGVMIWHPDTRRFSHCNLLTGAELAHVVEACVRQGVTPFVCTLEGDTEQAVYHPPLQNDFERRLLDFYMKGRELCIALLEELPVDARITNISAIGPRQDIRQIIALVDNQQHLVAYSGMAFEGTEFRWLDIHHSDASKGGAISVLKTMLGVERVICFGDNDNDLSMFALADESYAPANANDAIRSAATAVIGHHDEEGIARFLRERFDL